MTWDVLGIKEDTRIVRIVTGGHDERKADAVVRFCEANKGERREVYVAVESGMYERGDVFDAPLPTATLTESVEK